MVPLRTLVLAAALGAALLFSATELPSHWGGRFGRLLVEFMIVFLFTVWILRLALKKPVDELTQWMREARNGRSQSPPRLPRHGLLGPLAREAQTLADSLTKAEAAAAQEARLRDMADSLWTAEKLRERSRTLLRGRPLVLVANRQPYRHLRKGGKLVCEMPASGLVTGLEPILRACGGTWIAYGDGDADRELVDAEDRLKVPPENPQYYLKRVWLSPEEVQGYYDGFSNEGLWPLCHIAHTRPTFRLEDWAYYEWVNRKFAAATVAELGKRTEAFVLIQDYHFTLLPRLIKKARPDARVALFWHIPWPNPEAFGICPWQKEILDGMLGADLIGFHTQYHCNNFIETADRAFECHVDREHFAIRRGGHVTAVKPFPISVNFAEPPARDASWNREALREAIFQQNGVRPEFMAVGVDRLDYTKGLIERFQAVERFLEEHPAYQGRFTLFQLSAPSRAGISTYHNFRREVEAEAARVNSRFLVRCPPIVMRTRHHSHAEIMPYYRAADLCLVTALHDGMNLVAKEFAVSRDDERGVLILSRFTGAARELRDALIINPYDTQEVAQAMARGLEMNPSEQAERMAKLRQTVRENNVYRWAGSLMMELASMRTEAAEVA